MDIKLVKYTVFLFLIIFPISYGSTLQIMKGKSINVYNSSSFFSYSDINISEINNCDPDVYNTTSECLVYLTYFFPSDYFINLSLINGSFYTELNYTLIENRYDNIRDVYKIYATFPLPKGATNCEDFFNKDLFFNLSTIIFSNIPFLTNTSVTWKLRIDVWRCYDTLESCDGTNGYWYTCFYLTNTSNILVPKKQDQLYQSIWRRCKYC